jgi:hypothetical protein
VANPFASHEEEEEKRSKRLKIYYQLPEVKEKQKEHGKKYRLKPEFKEKARLQKQAYVAKNAEKVAEVKQAWRSKIVKCDHCELEINQSSLFAHMNHKHPETVEGAAEFVEKAKQRQQSTQVCRCPM